MLSHFSDACAFHEEGNPYHGPDRPFDDFAIPEFLKEFCTQTNGALGHYHEGAAAPAILLFGGAILDQYLGLKPKDYDLYIACPKLVAEMLDVHKAMGKTWAYEETLGYDFPLVLHDESFNFRAQKNFLGSCFNVNGMYLDNGKARRMDIIIGERPFSAEEFSKELRIPIMSPVVSMSAEGELYAYHPQFRKHADEKIMAVEYSDRKLEEKATRKGLSIIATGDDCRLSLSADTSAPESLLP